VNRARLLIFGAVIAATAVLAEHGQGYRFAG
jgi:hypothetical protein